MTIQFPLGPSVGDTFPYDAYIYTWDGEKWTVLAPGDTYWEKDDNGYLNADTSVIIDGDLSANNGTFAGPVRIGGTSVDNEMTVYEQGTFTPVYEAGIDNPVYTNTLGSYTRIGNSVNFTIRMQTTTGTNNVDQTVIGGLPYPAAGATTPAGGAFFTYASDIWNSEAPLMIVLEGTSSITFHTKSGAAWQGSADNGMVGQTFYITGQYFA